MGLIFLSFGGTIIKKARCHMDKIREFFNKIDRSMLIGVCLLIAGVLFFFASGDLLETLVRIAGGIVVAVAIVRFIRLMSIYAKGVYLTTALFSVALLFLLGLVMIMVPGGTLHIIFAAIGIYLIVNALIRAYRIASAPKKVKEPSWWLGVILTAAIFLLGFWLMLSPAEATRVTEIIAGIALIVKGAEMLSSSIASGKRGSKKRSDDIEADFVDKSDK